MAEYQAAGWPLHYWHKLHQGQFSFVPGRSSSNAGFGGGVGKDKKWLREFLWVLAAVPSPERERWSAEVLDALDAGTGALHDETSTYRPSDVDPKYKTPQRATRTRIGVWRGTWKPTPTAEDS